MKHLRRATNKYGMPKNTVHSVRPRFVSDEAEVWLRSRDEFLGMMADALQALNLGLISPRQYDREYARLRRAMWQTEQRYELERKARWRRPR